MATDIVVAIAALVGLVGFGLGYSCAKSVARTNFLELSRQSDDQLARYLRMRSYARKILEDK